MKFLRRSFAIVFTVLATLMLATALMVRVAYNAVFDTNTYVDTVTAIAKNPDSLSRVSNFIENTVIDSAHIDDARLAVVFRKAGINPGEFESRVRQTIHESVYSYLQSEQFITLWANTNRTAHTQLMALARSDTPVTEDFTIDLGPIVKAAAASLQDPNGYIAKVIPLKYFTPNGDSFQFKLVQASGVDDLRTATDIAGKARTDLLVSAVFLFVLTWLLLGRKRSSLQVIAIAFASAGIVAVVTRIVGKIVVGNLAGTEAKQSATTIFSITTAPLTGYAVLVIVLGCAGFAATFYRRNNS